jgi:diguanylate cyclase (GGDEF)-like protein
MAKNASADKNTQIMNMVIVLVWLVVFMIIILGIFFPLVFLTSLRQVYQREQSISIELSSKYIDEFFETRKTLLAVSADMPFLHDPELGKRVELQFHGVPEDDAVLIRTYFQKILDDYSSFRFFAYLSANNVQPVLLQPYSAQLALTDSQFLQGYAYREWAQQTISTYQKWDKKGSVPPYISDAFISQPGNVPAVSISVAVVDGEKNMTGILYVNMVLTKLSDYIKNLTFGKTGKVYLVDSSGHLLAHPSISPEVLSRESDGRETRELLDFSGNPMVANALKGIIRPGIYRMPDTQRLVLSTYRKIDTLGWIIVLEQDVEESFGLVRVYAYVIVFLVFISILISFIVFWYISRETAESVRRHNELLIISETDPLTGLLNRRSMLSRMSQFIADYEYNGQGFVIGMFDIDDFKKVNDTYGHVFGDIVLREIANRTVSILRVEDLLFRWGGEEFLVIIRNCDLVRGRGVAEKIRRIVCDTPINDGVSSVNVTVTIGLSQYRGDPVDTMIIHADEALYQGKRSGKNVVVVSED